MRTASVRVTVAFDPGWPL